MSDVAVEPTPAIVDVPPQRMPRHIAIIMDGNGRWAVRQGNKRTIGHQQGARVVKTIVTECSRLRDANIEAGGAGISQPARFMLSISTSRRDL